MPYYKYTPESVLENELYRSYFDRAILTDKTVPYSYNRLDTTLIDKINRTAQIIDIAIPNSHNLQNAFSEKLTKYEELKDEIMRMWKLKKLTIVPVVISTTGVIPKNLHQSIKTLDLAPYTYASPTKSSIFKLVQDC